MYFSIYSYSRSLVKHASRSRALLLVHSTAHYFYTFYKKLFIITKCMHVDINVITQLCLTQKTLHAVNMHWTYTWCQLQYMWCHRQLTRARHWAHTRLKPKIWVNYMKKQTVTATKQIPIWTPLVLISCMWNEPDYKDEEMHACKRWGILLPVYKSKGTFHFLEDITLVYYCIYTCNLFLNFSTLSKLFLKNL